MKYQCDTARECGHPRCPVKTPHEHAFSLDYARFSCKHARHWVRCNPIEEPRETHTCYFCDHTGQDVNRIAVVMPPKEYCCDDAVACDHRW